jgi:hypothetical protein
MASGRVGSESHIVALFAKCDDAVRSTGAVTFALDAVDVVVGTVNDRLAPGQVGMT